MDEIVPSGGGTIAAPMKAIRIHEDGGPEVLRYEDAPDPTPAAGEVLISLRAASLNRLDVWVRRGLPSVPKPRILGADGAGLVAGRGPRVEGLEEGQRVVINPGLEHGDGRITVIGEHTDGTHAELIAVPAENVHPLPDSLSFEQAAAFPLVYETVYRMLVTRAGLRAGEWVLAWGVGSGIGTATLSLAHALGARVIATSSSDEKLAKATELGAEVTINHASEDVAAHVKEATDGRGADLVVEHVGEATWQTSLAAAAPGARVVVCGATTGPNPKAALHRVWWKQLSILGSTMGTGSDFKGAFDLVADGRAPVVVDSVFPLAEARAAHERMERGEHMGKIVLRIPE
jgi:NADPH:quinone reductase-like Zn-dependent oxidoreductase